MESVTVIMAFKAGGRGLSGTQRHAAGRQVAGRCPDTASPLADWLTRRPHAGSAEVGVVGHRAGGASHPGIARQWRRDGQRGRGRRLLGGWSAAGDEPAEQAGCQTAEEAATRGLFGLHERSLRWENLVG
jgi:hypothetical protein